MTREEAIDLLDNLIGMIEDNHNSDYDTAFKMAIKALQQEPCNTDTCKVVKAYMNEWDKPNNSDAISRQAVIDLISNFILEIHSEGGRDLNAHTNDVLRQILRNVKSDRVLPSVKQEPNIVALGEEMRICRESITDEKVLIGFNMAVALCNKHLGESEG